jgi:hypothetical protein
MGAIGGATMVTLDWRDCSSQRPSKDAAATVNAKRGE